MNGCQVGQRAGGGRAHKKIKGKSKNRSAHALTTYRPHSAGAPLVRDADRKLSTTVNPLAMRDTHNARRSIVWEELDPGIWG